MKAYALLNCIQTSGLQSSGALKNVLRRTLCNKNEYLLLAPLTTADCRVHFRRGFLTTALPEITNQFPSLKTHDDIYQLSIKQPDVFWSSLARSHLQWQRDFKNISDHDIENKHFRWFPDGQINVAENCVDRHAKKDPNKVALIWEKDEPGQEERITYGQLQDLVNRFANVLLDSGVKANDRVAIYLSVSPIAVAAMLACARIGAIHTVVFAGFSAEALASRINAASAQTVITCDIATRGGRKIDLKKIVDEAVKYCPSVSRVFVAKKDKTQPSVHCSGKLDIDLDEALSTSSTTCPCAIRNSEDPLFLLYTSGSTGTPKGLLHTTAGYLLYASVTHKHVFDYRENEIYGCVADVGWITGHSYVVYGPLCNGATTVLFESTPTYPNPGRYWETVSRLGINHFYCSPTALRLLLRYGDSYPQAEDLSSLRVLGSVGEPINQEAWKWFNDVVGKGKCTLVDTWWQTETGGIMIAPRPSSPGAPINPGLPMRPMYGVEPALVDSDDTEVEGNNVEGALCIKSIWPGIARTIFGDHKRYIETYFSKYNGLYFSGDGAHRTSEGYYQITGRMDDVINVTGHRLGTAEVEDAMADHPDTSESAVIGVPHSLKGESVAAYVVLKEGVTTESGKIKEQLCKMVRNKIAGYAVPDVITIVPGLPKTRSGKVMRRLLRKISSGETDLGDISTLADPSIVQSLVKEVNRKS